VVFLSTRRDFLRVAFVGAAGLAVGAGAGYYIREGEVLSLRKRVDELLSKIGIELEDNLNIYNWTWYANLNLIEDFEKQHGLKLVYEFFEDLDTALSVIRAGQPVYDVAVISDNEAQELYQEGYLQEIDLDKIPNFEHVPEGFKGLEYDPDNTFSVIYSYGTTGIGYNSEVVDKPITKWEDIFDVDNPDSHIRRYAGKVTMMPDSGETLGAALIYLGYDPDSVNESELQEAADVLLAQKQYLYGYKSTEDYMDVLPVGTPYAISHAWNGDIAGAVYAADEYEVLIERYYEHLRYVVPEEGAIAWYDNFVIPANAVNINAAHAFINWFLDPVISAIHCITIKYPYPAGLKYTPTELKEDPMIFTPPEVWDRLFIGRPMTPEERALREQYWTMVMTG
jgi:spermidine/putrescine-binding protein